MHFEPDDQAERNPLEHDILVVRRNRTNRQFFKVQAKKKLDQGGQVDTDRAAYTGVTELLPKDEGYRAIVGLACAESLQGTGASASAPRGPVLAALPLHPNPTASAGCTCYLVNPENLTYETSWTHWEWNDQKVQETDNPVRDDDAIELLVATPAGRVYLLTKANNENAVRSTLIDLRQESELWNLLRNGCVAGSARLVAHPVDRDRIVPVVNVEALAPSPLPPLR